MDLEGLKYIATECANVRRGNGYRCQLYASVFPLGTQKNIDLQCAWTAFEKNVPTS